SRRAPRAPPPGSGPRPPPRAPPGGAASPLELLVVGDAPAPLGEAHRDQPAALEAVCILDRDAAAVEVADGCGAVGVLLEEPVVHPRLARRLVDRLALDEPELVLHLLAGDTARELERGREIDAHVVRVEEALGGAARRVAGAAAARAEGGGQHESGRAPRAHPPGALSPQPQPVPLSTTLRSSPWGRRLGGG